MKKLLSIVAVAALSAGAIAQTTLYSENFGIGSSSNPTFTNYTGYQNSTPILYSGTGDIRTTNPSATSAYAGASGAANGMINASNEILLIEGINTSGKSGLVLSFGQRKGASAANNELTVEVSEDGTTWLPLAYTRPTGSGTSNWALVTPTGTIPATTNLRIRFTGTDGTEWRIDDIKITYSGFLAISENINHKSNFVRNTVAEDFVNFGAKSDVKVYNMNGQLVKSASVSETRNLQVSDLTPGVYVVTGTVNGQAVSQKITKK